MYITTPDKWLIIKCSENLYKVFATFYSGYGSGDSWKINSGIVRVEESDDMYYFFGFSGSCYHCKKNDYGSSEYGYSVIDSYNVKLLEEGFNKLEILENNCNWCKFFEHLS